MITQFNIERTIKCASPRSFIELPSLRNGQIVQSPNGECFRYSTIAGCAVPVEVFKGNIVLLNTLDGDVDPQAAGWAEGGIGASSVDGEIRTLTVNPADLSFFSFTHNLDSTSNLWVSVLARNVASGTVLGSQVSIINGSRALFIGGSGGIWNFGGAILQFAKPVNSLVHSAIFLVLTAAEGKAWVNGRLYGLEAVSGLSPAASKQFLFGDNNVGTAGEAYYSHVRVGAF